MLPGLENMKFDWNVGLAPGDEHIDCALISHSFIVRCDGNEHRRRTCRRSVTIRLGCVDRGGEVWPTLGLAFGGANDHRTPGRKSDHPDTIGLKSIFGRTLPKYPHRLLSI